jgi:hypothetical protein
MKGGGIWNKDGEENHGDSENTENLGRSMEHR